MQTTYQAVHPVKVAAVLCYAGPIITMIASSEIVGYNLVIFPIYSLDTGNIFPF